MSANPNIYNPSLDHVPAVTAPMLYSRRKVPREAFTKFDKEGAGQVGLEDLRQAMGSLGIKLTLNEAKAMIMKQRDGDRGAKLSDLRFDYQVFLQALGADKGRSDAAAERFATDRDREATDVQNPVPTPSAAAAIVERLRKERGSGGGEGYMSSLFDEQPRQKAPIDTTFARSELDKLGGLAYYLSEDNVEATAPGYLPRMPGEEHARKAVDDKMFTKGEFTGMGIASWNEHEVEALPVGYHAMPGQQPHRLPTDTGLFMGALDRSGGISGYIADKDRKDVPEGYAYVFPGDAYPRRIAQDPAHVMGELADRGGLVNYLADTETDSKAEEGYMPRMPGQQYAERKETDRFHHGGELTSTGLSGFISDPTAHAGAKDGYITSMTSMAQRKVTRTAEESIVQHGSFAVGSGERVTDAGGNMVRGGRYSRVVDDVPILPEDVRIEGTDMVPVEHLLSRAQLEATQGLTGEISKIGGVTYYVNSPSKAKKPMATVDYPQPIVGTLSKLGGLGSYVTEAAKAEDGVLSALPGQAYGHSKLDQTAYMGVRGGVESAGNIYAFVASGGDYTVPEGYLAPLRPGEAPRKKAETEKAFIGMLDQVGGLGGFYSSNISAGGPLPGQEFVHQSNFDMERAALSGHIEGAGGVGKFMMSTPKPPAGYVTDITGENIRLAPNDEALRGTLEKTGGLGGWYTDQHANDQATDGYSGFSWEQKRKTMVDPLHHYGTISAEGASAFSLGASVHDLNDGIAVPDHKRSIKMKSGRLTEQRDVDVDKHERTDRHLINSRMAELNKDAEVTHTREVSIVAGKRANARAEQVEGMVDGRETSLVQIRRDLAALHQRPEEQPSAGGRDPHGISDGREISLISLQREARERQERVVNGISHLRAEGSGRRVEHEPQPAIARAVSMSGHSVSGQSDAGSVAGSVAGSESRVPGTPTGEPRSPGMGYAIRHAKVASASSPRSNSVSTPVVAATPAATSNGMDLRRLARVRKAIRDMLPKKTLAAQALLRQKLHKEDGDSDGVVSDIELLRGLCALTPGLAASDVGFLIRYFKDKFRAETEKLVSTGIRDSDTTGGLAAGVSLSAVAEWMTKQPGGHESKYVRDAEESAEGEVAPPAGPTVVGDRMTWTSRAQKFTVFRNSWEERHGGAAMKEIAHDLAQPVEGPTWTRADPQPFKVLHLSAGAPPSPRPFK